MLENISVYIPTSRRWDTMTTQRLYPSSIIVCPESQLDMYSKYHPTMKILSCPDDVEGNIARKRNWIKRQCETPYFVMMDDDLESINVLEDMKRKKLSTPEIEELFVTGFTMMEDLGTVLWGLNVNPDPVCYRENIPFKLLAPILGPFTAQKNDKDIWYDERLSLKEDYDFSLQVLHKYHKILRFNKYNYLANHIKNDGGCTDYRTKSREEEQNELLQRKWGRNIVRYDMKKSINPILKIPYKGI